MAKGVGSDDELARLVETKLSLGPCRSPIQELPSDLLYSVFLVCHAQDSEEKLATTASHVCQSWRTCALNATVLWSHIVIKTLRPALEKYEAWINRSGEAPLTIELCAPVCKKSSVPTMRRICELIVPHARRWKKLSVLFIPDKAVRVLFDQLINVEVPLLEEFIVDAITRPPHWKFRPFEAGAPKLHELKIAYINFTANSTLLKSVRRLTIGNPRAWTDQSFVTVLAHAPNVEWFFPPVDQIPRTERLLPPPGSPPIVHQSLSTLCIRAELLNIIPYAIEFPNLTEIRLASITAPWKDSVDRFARGAPRLERLDLIGVGTRDNPGAEETLVELFSNFSAVTSLREIELSMVDFDQKPRLAARLGTAFPPSVDTIKFMGCKELMSEGLMEMITYRKHTEGLTPFRKVWIDAYTSFFLDKDNHEEFRPWLRTQVAEVRIPPSFWALLGLNS